MFREVIYKWLATICCLTCHGRCCFGIMSFELEHSNGRVTFISKGNIHHRCAAYSILLGICKEYSNRNTEHNICKHWKCRTLNWLSRLFKQPIWNGYVNE